MGIASTRTSRLLRKSGLLLSFHKVRSLGLNYRAVTETDSRNMTAVLVNTEGSSRASSTLKSATPEQSIHVIHLSWLHTLHTLLAVNVSDVCCTIDEVVIEIVYIWVLCYSPSVSSRSPPLHLPLRHLILLNPPWFLLMRSMHRHV